MTAESKSVPKLPRMLNPQQLCRLLLKTGFVFHTKFAGGHTIMILYRIHMCTHVYMCVRVCVCVCVCVYE